MRKPLSRLLAGLTAVLLAGAVRAGEVPVAVAASFRAPFQALAARFERATGHQALAIYGPSGGLDAQIRNGAPFAVLLGADSATAQRLEAEGFGVPGSRFTYARGRLALWSAQPGYVDARGAVLRHADFRHLALASPRSAPYGLAASQVLDNLGLRRQLAGKLLEGDGIARAYRAVAGGGAELGFVALAQVYRDGRIDGGSAWLVPESLYAPIRQDAVLLAGGRDNPAARALLDYLRSPEAATVIAAYGYDL